MGFGDGYVEIEEVKLVGGVTVGVATKEPACAEVDEWKRQRLIGVGADYIVPNFLARQRLLEFAVCVSTLCVNTLAIDIGGTKFTLALFEERAHDAAGIARYRSRRRPRVDAGAVRAHCFRSWSGIERCGIGFGGPVDFQRQRVALSTHVGGWQDFPLARHLRDLLGVPTIMDNDANVGALGEARYGAGGVLPLFYVTLSTGIGGGLILGDGSVYRGADSGRGRLGI